MFLVHIGYTLYPSLCPSLCAGGLCHPVGAVERAPGPLALLLCHHDVTTYYLLKTEYAPRYAVRIVHVVHVVCTYSVTLLSTIP